MLEAMLDDAALMVLTTAAIELPPAMAEACDITVVDAVVDVASPLCTSKPVSKMLRRRDVNVYVGSLMLALPSAMSFVKPRALARDATMAAPISPLVSAAIIDSDKPLKDTASDR